MYAAGRSGTSIVALTVCRPDSASSAGASVRSVRASSFTSAKDALTVPVADTAASCGPVALAFRSNATVWFDSPCPSGTSTDRFFAWPVTFAVTPSLPPEKLTRPSKLPEVTRGPAGAAGSAGAATASSFARSDEISSSPLPAYVGAASVPPTASWIGSRPLLTDRNGVSTFSSVTFTSSASPAAEIAPPNSTCNCWLSTSRWPSEMTVRPGVVIFSGSVSTIFCCCPLADPAPLMSTLPPGTCTVGGT